ncbi:WYL domain-containing protein [Acidipropionibacterium timonense]|uniref:WYL domain-containing protein n=1 Tax=Acidipropionibacterium timonense TaxID=2161818 RepID=UPI001031D799
MSAKRSERLVNLVIALLVTDRPLTRSTLRQTIEDYRQGSDDAFKRSFERDKEELRRLGIDIRTVPLDTLAGAEVGYRIPRHEFELPAVQFTQPEADALGMAARVWRESVLDESSTAALAKLRAAGVDPDTEAGLPTQVSSGADEAGFEELWGASLAGAPVEFTYREERVRHVDPWRLVLRRGHWYLLGRDRDADEPRVFRLSRITSSVRTTGEPGTVSRPDPALVADHLRRLEPPPSPPVEATLAVREGTRMPGVTLEPVDPGSAPHRGDDLLRGGPGAMAPVDGPAPDPSRSGDAGRPSRVVVRATCAGVEELATAVLRAGGDALVLGPDDVREEIVARIRRVSQLDWVRRAAS